MIEVDINFIRDWTDAKFNECRKWLEEYPHYGDFEVDETKGIMYFENEQDATFFILRWL